ncbi:MAG: AmmeMemoRadiSam system protein B [Planctomycetia bacterium]|nr:AmmeMemoRadiSam system protein B [Planctomycetia bacterium]
MSENQPQTHSPSLSDVQKQAILRAAGRKVALSIARTADSISAEELEGAANIPVYGVFVSLKRKNQLRACCGWIRETASFREALEQAALRAATEDDRFPALRPSEIKDLEMEVWILARPERIAGQGESRADYVEIGRHGLQVIHPIGQGLLLPSVAVEWNLSPVGFLEQVCRKASLPVDAWKEEKVILLRFDAECLRASLKDLIGEEFPELLTVEENPFKPDARDLAKLADHCYRNVLKLSRGEIPDYYLPGAFDGEVHGICVRVRLVTRYADCAQFSLSRPVPLQATLLQLAQNIAVAMKQNQMPEGMPFETDICLMWDLQPAGDALNPLLEGLETKRHGLLLTRFGRWQLAYVSRKKPESLLEEGLRYSGFPVDEDTKVYIVRVASNKSRFITSSVQKPKETTEARKPLVAGSFYPADAMKLERMLDQFLLLDDSLRNIPKKSYVGAIVPHAGWKYSGQLMAQTLSKMEYPSRILVLAPKHSSIGLDWAVCPCGRWLLPGRSMEGDPRLASQLVKAVPDFRLDAFSHEREHAIEVILPVLARLAPGSHLVGMVMNGRENRLTETAKSLANWMASLPEMPLLIATTDMNHYASEEHTRKVDALVRAAIEERNPEKMLQIVREKNISMCGVLPVALLMMTLRELNLLHQVTPVGYCTSAQSSGDSESVVGYYGALIE